MYNGVYVTRSVSAAIGAGFVLAELQVPAGTQVEIIRFWMGAAENADPIADVQEVELYTNDALSTAASGMTVEKLQGSSDATTSVTVVNNATQGATPNILIRDTFHLYNGYLYLPYPDERPRLTGGATAAIGYTFPVAPDASITVSYGVVWGELG
jgi:hypothetical protein